MIRSLRSILVVAILPFLAAPAAAAAGEALDLDDCLELAYQHSPELASGEQQLLSTRASLLAAYGSFLPSISTSVNYGHQFVGPKPASTQYNTITQEFFTQAPIESRDYESYSFSINGGITLFSGLSRWSDLSAQKYNYSAGEADLEDTRHRVESSVIQAYFDLVKAQMSVELKISDLEAKREQHDQSRRSFEMGAVARSDTLRSGVLLAQARLGLLEAENARDLANVNLATLIGRNPTAALELSPPSIDGFVSVDREQAIAAALEMNPSLRAAALRASAAELGVREARAGLWPSLSAGYRFGWSDLSPPDGALDVFDQDYTYALSLSANWTLFDRFQTKRGIQQARASARQQEYSLDEQRRGIVQGVESILVNLANARKRIELARITIALAEEDLRLARERYRVGAATILEVSEAEVSLVEGRSSEIEGVTGYLSALAELERNTGWRLGR